MRPLIFNAAVVAAVVIVGVGGFVAGWELKGSSAASPDTLSILAAGSLAPILPMFATAFVSATPGVSDPASAQLYEGSGTAASSLAGGHQPYDVFVAADFRTIPTSIETPSPTVASWEVVFASDPMVLAYEPGVGALSGMNSGNWWTKIVAAGVTLGAPNASSDPLGANAIFTLELEDAAQGLGGSLYGHFYSGAEGALASPTAATRLISENDAATALSGGTVDVFLIYRSFAVADGLHYLNLSTNVNLGGTSSANETTYGSAATTVLSGTSTKSESGAPVLFSLTVPTTAQDRVVGVAFAAFLLSNATATMWANIGFDPLAPAWSDHPTNVPAALTGSTSGGVTLLPSYLSALI